MTKSSITSKVWRATYQPDPSSAITECFITSETPISYEEASRRSPEGTGCLEPVMDQPNATTRAAMAEAEKLLNTPGHKDKAAFMASLKSPAAPLRYEFDGRDADVFHSVDGPYVLHSDYVALQAQIQKLTLQRDTALYVIGAELHKAQCEIAQLLLLTDVQGGWLEFYRDEQIARNKLSS